MIRRMMTAFAGAALGLFALQLVGVSPSGAAESRPPDSYCDLAGSIAPDPGLSYESKPTTYQLNGTMDCTADQPTHGTVTGTGKGTTGCFGGTSSALLKVAWDNGTVSTINVQLGEFMYGTGGHGMVEEGAFKDLGVYMGWGRHAARAEERCANAQVKSYEIAGYMYFHQHSQHSGH
jgi:hypothetical protein